MEIVKYPSPILSKQCKCVSIGDKDIPKILDSMLEVMYANNGAGLAGPQCGILKKILVMDLREEPKKVYKLINPKIIWKSEEVIESEEGCLSLPKIRGKIIRHASVSVEYLNENYEKCSIEKANEYLSICLQHEIDHLFGKLYIDRMSRVKRGRLLQKYKKIQLGEIYIENECNIDGKI